MADLHKAIRAIHSSVVNVNGDTEETITATDNNGDNVTINWSSVNAWTDPNEYKYKTEAEYKELKEQLDLLYHDMVADKGDKTGEWFKHIKAVKDANPKE